MPKNKWLATFQKVQRGTWGSIDLHGQRRTTQRYAVVEGHTETQARAEVTRLLTDKAYAPEILRNGFTCWELRKLEYQLTEGRCNALVRGRLCRLEPKHKGGHATVAYCCDGCSKYRRGVPTTHGPEGLGYCFVCSKHGRLANYYVGEEA